jgi:transcriptional regulator GlxA family with amidase domain
MQIRVYPDFEGTAGRLCLRLMQTSKFSPPPAKARHYRHLVKRIVAVACARMDLPLHIADLCAAAAVSQRTLRNAFHVVHGTSPYRYLRGFRMREARNALLSPDCAGLTVTQVATRFGFFELGRFAVEYRMTFGESPSETLRRASTAAAESPLHRAPALTAQSGYAASP